MLEWRIHQGTIYNELSNISPPPVHIMQTNSNYKKTKQYFPVLCFRNLLEVKLVSNY